MKSVSSAPKSEAGHVTNRKVPGPTFEVYEAGSATETLDFGKIASAVRVCKGKHRGRPWSPGGEGLSCAAQTDQRKTRVVVCPLANDPLSRLLRRVTSLMERDNSSSDGVPDDIFALPSAGYSHSPRA